MKFLLARSLLGIVSSVLIASSSLIVNVDTAQAYTNYDQCVAEVSAALGAGQPLSNAQRTQVTTSCRREFPSSQGSNTTSNSTSNNVTPIPSSSVRSVPPSSAARAPSAAPSVRSNSSSSSSSNGDRSGDVPPSMFGNRSDPNSIFRDPPQGANVDTNADQYAQPLIQLSDRQLAFQILVNFFLGIISVICLLFLVFNGYRYALARGEDNQISQAKKGITYAIIGLIVVLAAYTIVATLLNFGAQSAAPGIGISVGVQL